MIGSIGADSHFVKFAFSHFGSTVKEAVVCQVDKHALTSDAKYHLQSIMACHSACQDKTTSQTSQENSFTSFECLICSIICHLCNKICFSGQSTTDNLSKEFVKFIDTVEVKKLNPDRAAIINLLFVQIQYSSY